MKKVLAGIMVLAFVALFAASVSALAVHDIHRSRTLFHVSIKGYATVGIYGTGDFGSDRSRRVKGCWVEMEQGRDYEYAEAVGTSYDEKHNRQISTREVKFANNWFITAYSRWSWYYF